MVTEDPGVRGDQMDTCGTIPLNIHSPWQIAARAARTWTADEVAVQVGASNTASLHDTLSLNSRPLA